MAQEEAHDWLGFETVCRLLRIGKLQQISVLGYVVSDPSNDQVGGFLGRGVSC